MKKLVLSALLSLGVLACMPPLPTVVTLPDVELPVVSEETVVWNSAEYKGKPALVVFMGSWCPWCKKTMPAVMEIANEFGDQVEIVAVFMDGDATPVKNAIKEHKFTVKSAYNGAELAQALQVQGLPHSVLFDKKHRAIASWDGYSPERANDYRTALQKLVK